MSLDKAKELNLKTTQTSGVITTALKNAVVEQVAVTEPVQVQYGSTMVSASFHVVPQYPIAKRLKADEDACIMQRFKCLAHYYFACLLRKMSL